jgi:hypothetical protein
MATEGMPAPHKPETTASTRFELCLKSGAEDRRPSARGLKPTSNAFDNFLWGQCILSHVTLYHSGDHRPSTASMEATPPQPQPQPFYKPLGRGRLRGFQGPVSPERLRPLRDTLRDWFRGLRSESGSSGTSFGRGSGVGGRVDGRGGVDEQMGFLGRFPLSFPQSFWLKFFNCGGHAFLEHLDIGP